LIVTGVPSVTRFQISSMSALATAIPRRSGQLIARLLRDGDEDRPLIAELAGGLTPVELCSVGIAPIVRQVANEPLELHAITYHFDSMGVM